MTYVETSGAPTRVGGVSLQVRGLTWTPLGRRGPVLDRVELSVAAGERVLVVGASGAGKSTLLRGLAGVLDVVEPGDLSGQVLIDGTSTRPGDGRVGLLVQDPSDARVAGTIGRDIAFGPENLGLPRAQIADRVAWALAAVDLPYGPGHAAAALSGGESQRLALAGVLALMPQVLLLDEPTSMLDDDSAARVRDVVSAVVDDTGATLVVVEHRIDGWVDLVDRLVVLGQGRGVIADGPVRRVLAEHREELLAAGIWVPGEPAPTPDSVDSAWCDPWLDLPTPGEALLGARGVRVVRRPRRGLRVVRAAEPDVVVLDGLDVDVAAGRSLALRGRSGAGKSTLLGVLLGLEGPTAGEVRAGPSYAPGPVLQPHRWSSRELAARVGWVPQRAQLTLTSNESVRDCLLATPRALGRLEGPRAAAAYARVDGLLETLGLGPLAHRNPHHLSGGELRRLAVAGALAHGPAVLGFDEPTVGQDRLTWAAVAGLMMSAREAGCAVLAGTHDAALARRCDATVTLRAGRVVPEPAPELVPGLVRDPVEDAVEDGARKRSPGAHP